MILAVMTPSEVTFLFPILKKSNLKLLIIQESSTGINKKSFRNYHGIAISNSNMLAPRAHYLMCPELSLVL